MSWKLIKDAPEDGTVVWVYCPPAHGLPELQCACAYHPDAGWCVDELRYTTHWIYMSELTKIIRWPEPPE